MDRREINHVEPHRLRVLHPRRQSRKVEPRSAEPFGRTRKKFIPGRSPRFHPVHDHARRRHVLRRAGRDADKSPSALRARPSAPACSPPRSHPSRIRSANSFSRFASSPRAYSRRGGEQRGPFQLLALQIRETGFKLRGILVLPAGERYPSKPRPCIRRWHFRRANKRRASDRSTADCIADSCHAGSPTMRHFSTAATISWPSLNTSASTTTSSPTTRLIG